MSSALSSLDRRIIPAVRYLLRYARNGTVTSTFRTYAEQARLYRAWVEGRTPYPAAEPGTSMHEYRLAVDISADNLPELGALWERMGGRWGGTRDPIHFQVRTG